MQDSGWSELRPLASYDEMAARELEAMHRMNDELNRETETLRVELQRLNRQLQAGDGKSRIKALKAEQAHYEEQADRVGMEILRLKSEIGSIKIDIDPEQIDLEYERLTREVQSLIAMRDEMHRAVPLIEAEINALKQEIDHKEARLSDDLRTSEEVSKQAQQASSRIAALKGLHEAFSRHRGTSDDPYRERIAKVSEALNRKDTVALKEAASLSSELESALSHTIAEGKGLFGCLGEKYSLLRGILDREQLLPPMQSETEAISKTLKDKAEDLERLRSLNVQDKAKAEQIEAELSRLRGEVSQASEEVAKVRQLTSSKDAIETEFIQLYVQNVDLSETIQAVAKKMQEINNTLRRGL